jgi:hypothetical protein
MDRAAHEARTGSRFLPSAGQGAQAHVQRPHAAVLQTEVSVIRHILWIVTTDTGSAPGA